ncbi:MAG: hypothetical protein WB561_05720 [Terracidiphilus sp.]
MRTGHVAGDPVLLVPSLSASRPSMRLSFGLLHDKMIGPAEQNLRWQVPPLLSA